MSSFPSLSSCVISRLMGPVPWSFVALPPFEGLLPGPAPRGLRAYPVPELLLANPNSMPNGILALTALPYELICPLAIPYVDRK